MKVSSSWLREEKLGIDLLIRKILHSDYTLTDALESTVADLKPKILPLRSKILGLFKNPTERNTPYYVGKDADEEVLLEMFAMRLRERMILFGSQRIKSGYYLLMLRRQNGSSEFLGVYDTNKQLKKVYQEAHEKYTDEDDTATLEIYAVDQEEGTLLQTYRKVELKNL